MFSKTYIVDNIPGSLSNIYDIKILICYTLKNSKKPLTKYHLHYVFQLNETVNYFNFCQAVKELIDTNHIVEKYGENKNEPFLHLTKLGKETAIVLKNNIPKSILEKTMREIENLLKKEHQNKNRKLLIKKQPDGYITKLVLEETESNLIDLELYCPTKEHAEKIKKEMEMKTTELYECILAVLENNSNKLKEISKKLNKNSKF